MLAGHTTTLKIDLNMLRGDRIRARRDFVEYGEAVTGLSEGDTVAALDEEGDVYIAFVESVDGLRVRLRLDLSSRTPTEQAWRVSNPYSTYPDPSNPGSHEDQPLTRPLAPA